MDEHRPPQGGPSAAVDARPPRDARAREAEEFEKRLRGATRRLASDLHRDRKADERSLRRRRRRRNRPRFGSPVLLGLLALALGALTALNLTGNGLFQLRPDPFTASDLERFLQIEAEGIEAYRERLGRLPLDLEAVDLPADGPWSYDPAGEAFRLALVEPDTTFVYDSAAPAGARIEAVPSAELREDGR